MLKVLFSEDQVVIPFSLMASLATPLGSIKVFPPRGMVVVSDIINFVCGASFGSQAVAEIEKIKHRISKIFLFIGQLKFKSIHFYFLIIENRQIALPIKISYVYEINLLTQ
jgi:hypothetical protein